MSNYPKRDLVKIQVATVDYMGFTVYNKGINKAKEGIDMTLANLVLRDVMMKVIREEFDDYEWTRFGITSAETRFTIKGEDKETEVDVEAQCEIVDTMVEVLIVDESGYILTSAYYEYDKISEYINEK